MLRKIALYFLKSINRDIKINHHYINEDLNLNLYKHKGYWFKGKNRERLTMEAFQNLISEGQNVIEIGGHIGYISMYFSSLVGENGTVDVFEPGFNNIPYIEKNIAPIKNIKLVKKGAGSKNEKMEFFVENLTGQNNSFVSNFKGFDNNKAESIEKNMEYEVAIVDVITLDSYVEGKSKQQFPDFIKIDVEGFEYEVIKGAKKIIEKSQTIFMVELQANFEEIYDMFVQNSYSLFYENGEKINSLEDFKSYKYGMNRFFIPENKVGNFQDWIK